MTECPVFDYENMPYLSAKGIWSKTGNFKRLTASLFIETCHDHLRHEALWSLTQEAVYVPDRDVWLPSAARTYVYAADEYDALRKIVGELEQWEILKSRPWFKEHLEKWEAEYAYLQRSLMIKELREVALSGMAGNVTAARTIISILEKKPVGRPKKVKLPELVDQEVTSDHDRVVSIFKKKS